MIPFFRSIAELRAISKSREEQNKRNQTHQINSLGEDIGQRKPYLELGDERQITLPDIPTVTKRKWIKSKVAISEFIKDLDYNNQIQSTYDITLSERQRNRNHKDAA